MSLEPGDRVFVWGRHYLVKDRAKRKNRDGETLVQVLLSEVHRPKVKAQWVDEYRVQRHAVT